MKTAKQISKIAKTVLQKYDGEYAYLGIRVQEDAADAVAGQEMTHRSHIWIDGEDTGELLNGLCAVSAKAAAKYNLSFGAYTGDIVLILGSDSADYGEDDGEIIMREPVVLAIV